MNKKKVQETFVALMNSCVEGYTGEWDPTGEGLDGFEVMYDQLAKLAEHYGVKVPGVKEI